MTKSPACLTLRQSAAACGRFPLKKQRHLHKNALLFLSLFSMCVVTGFFFTIGNRHTIGYNKNVVVTVQSGLRIYCADRAKE